MSGDAAAYSADTSSLISSIRSFYPPENFPALWEQVDGLIDSQRLVISEEVALEIEDKDDGVADWLKDRRDRIVVPTDAEVAAVVTSILDPYPELVKELKNRNRADPFVIAVAQIRAAVVVTEEDGRGSIARPRIPLICARLGIECITFYRLIQREGWTF